MDKQTQTGEKIRQSRVTINDLSEALGLTKGTVSRALNEYRDISPKTRHRVQQAAKRMGYQPLSHAQAIKTGRARALALVVQTHQHDGNRPFLADFLAGISSFASAEGWSLTVATAESDATTLDVMARLIEERKADGFILPRTQCYDTRVDMLRSRGVPFVLYGRVADDRECAWFDIRGEDAMRDSVLRLVELGHRRIAFVNGGNQFNYSALRLVGYKDGLKAAGLPFDPDLVRADCMTPETGEAAARGLLSASAPPTGFVYALDTAALGVYRAAEALGLKVGAEVSVISYDGIPEGAFANPPLSTYSVDNRTAGERLAQLLITRIRGADPHSLRQTETATFHDRGSAQPPTTCSAGLAERIAQHIQ